MYLQSPNLFTYLIHHLSLSPYLITQSCFHLSNLFINLGSFLVPITSIFDIKRQLWQHKYGIKIMKYKDSGYIYLVSTFASQCISFWNSYSIFRIHAVQIQFFLNGFSALDLQICSTVPFGFVVSSETCMIYRITLYLH